MAMVVNHNIPALSTYNVVNSTSNALSKSIKKLSTGLRINAAADDAAGLAISEKMRAQIGGLSKAADNAQDGISMLQTAEGALTETHSILQRMRELSVQAANDTLTSQDRAYIQLEIDELRDEITNIGNTTQFNTKKLLNGDAAVMWSSSDNSTKAIINGGLRKIDQFGQKASAEANYKIQIQALSGEGQVQKTDIMKIKHENVGVADTAAGTLTFSNLSDSIVEQMVNDGRDFTFNYDGTQYTVTAAQIKANGATKYIDKLAAEIANATDSGGNTIATSVTGAVVTSTVDGATMNTGLKITDTANKSMSGSLPTIGLVADKTTKLRDIDKFWTSDGVFMLDDPKTITITQGDGQQATVTLYGTDTVEDMRSKLNDAISNDLGQKAYLSTAADKFVTFVDKATGDAATATDANSVGGTMVIRSAVAGKIGELSFSADEELLNALSLNEIHASAEARYKVKVEDAHDGTVIANNVEITGNKMIGIIDENVDVEFDSMLGANVKATDQNGYFTIADAHTIDTDAYTTYLHLSDNTTVFQVGANEGEDMLVNIGDMRAQALGLNQVLVTDRDSAARSITVIDDAIDKVSTQRAKIGAYQNRLEYKISNLTTAYENMSSAESRIRDTDMASEMMTFMKLQINLQAGTAMLAQANQLSQNVLSLIG